MLRYDFTVTDEELDTMNGDFGQNLRLPKNFEPTAEPFDGTSQRNASEPKILINPQTTLLCDMVGLSDPYAIFLGNPVGSGNISSNRSFDASINNSDFIDSTTHNPDEISLDDLDEEENLDSGDLPVPLPPTAKLDLCPTSKSDSGDLPVPLPPAAKPDLCPTSKSDCVDDQPQNLSPSTDSIEIIAHNEQKLDSTNAEQTLLTSVEQKSVSTDTEQQSALAHSEQNLVSTDVEQKAISTDVEQNAISTDVEQKSVLADCEQNLVSGDKTVDSEATPKDEVVGRTLKRRNLSIYGTEEGMANDS